MKPGFTLVATVQPIEFGNLFRKWSGIPSEAMQTDGKPESGVEMWIANEWIDWVYFRATDKYRPRGDTGNLRSNWKTPQGNVSNEII